MTTFVSKNYEGLTPKNETEEAGVTLTPSDKLEVKESEPTEGLSEVKITIVGPISEIVAKALNVVFKNPDAIAYSEESFQVGNGKTFTFSFENASTPKDMIVYCVDLESINDNPVNRMSEISVEVRKFALEHNQDVIAYVNTNGEPVKRNQESWFISNVTTWTKGSFFSQESLVRYLSSFVQVKA